MRCEQNVTLSGDREWSAAAVWHRLWCEECRRDHRTDRFINRAAEQLRGASAPSGSLERTLQAVGCPPAGSVAQAESRRAERAALAAALALVGAGILATTITQPDHIGMWLFRGHRVPTPPGPRAAEFWALLGLFWYLKPVVALLLDSVPGLKTRRRGCLLGAVIGAAALWLVPALQPSFARAMGPALGIALNALLALASTILGGYLVEQARRIGASGRLGALHLAAMQTAGVAAPMLGMLVGAAAAPAVAAGLLAVFAGLAALVFPGSTPRAATAAPPAIGEQLRAILGARDLWHVSSLIVLVFGASSFGWLLESRQAMQGYSQGQIVLLDRLARASVLISILAYALLCRRVGLRSLVPFGIVANAGGTLLYLAYAGPLTFGAAAAIEVVNGLACALIMVTLFDLAVRAVPRQCPYLGYAILMSVMSASRAVSELLATHLPLNFPAIVVLSAITSGTALLPVMRLPVALLRRREGEPAPGSRAAALGG